LFVRKVIGTPEPWISDFLFMLLCPTNLNNTTSGQLKNQLNDYDKFYNSGASIPKKKKPAPELENDQ